MVGVYVTLPATCEACGKAFQALRCKVVQGKGRYCSTTCSGRANISRVDRTRKIGPFAADDPRRTKVAQKAIISPEIADNEALVTAFWLKVRGGLPDECWAWTGSVGGDGYGLLRHRGATYRATRLSWQIHNAEPLGQQYVCHSCDNPICVNPAHLWAGTQTDNMRDCSRKGRMVFRGETCAHGHPWSDENTYRDIKNGRERWRCKTCMSAERKRYLAKKRQETLAASSLRTS